MTNITTIHPEMHGETNDTIQAEYSAISNRYIIRSIEEIKKARGITFDGIVAEIGANSRPNKRAGWYRYYMTPLAFDNFKQTNKLTINLYLD